MSDLAFFIQLVANQYGVNPSTTTILRLDLGQGHALLKLEHPNGTAWLLRAFRRDSLLPIWVAPNARASWLRQQAGLLQRLEAVGYPAPRLILTTNQAELAEYHEWLVMMLTFCSGTPAQATLEDLQLLGQTLGTLHRTTMTWDKQFGISVTDSWWHPLAKIQRDSLVRLSMAAQEIPQAWRALHQAFLRSLTHVPRLRHLPRAVIHGDCWLGNAVRMGSVMQLIDWECAGYGVPLLDLGTLLSDCYTLARPSGQPCADKVRIGAVLTGYCRTYQLSEEEQERMVDGLQCSIAFRGAVRFAMAQQKGWTEDIERGLVRESQRYLVSEAIASIACQTLDKVAKGNT